MRKPLSTKKESSDTVAPGTTSRWGMGRITFMWATKTMSTASPRIPSKALICPRLREGGTEGSRGVACACPESAVGVIAIRPRVGRLSEGATWSHYPWSRWQRLAGSPPGPSRQGSGTRKVAGRQVATAPGRDLQRADDVDRPRSLPSAEAPVDAQPWPGGGTCPKSQKEALEGDGGSR